MCLRLSFLASLGSAIGPHGALNISSSRLWRAVQAPKGKAGTEIEPFKWLNVVLGNLKTALSGTHHAFSFAKYARRYLAEVQYRFNRRSDMASMVPRMAFVVKHTRPCPSGPP